MLIQHQRAFLLNWFAPFPSQALLPAAKEGVAGAAEAGGAGVATVAVVDVV